MGRISRPSPSPVFRPQLGGEVPPHRHAQGEQEHRRCQHVEVLRQGLQRMGLQAELARHPAVIAQPPIGQAAEGRQEGAQVQAPALQGGHLPSPWST